MTLRTKYISAFNKFCILGTATAFALAGCNTSETTQGTSAQGKLTIATSSYPLSYLVENIGGPFVNIQELPTASRTAGSADISYSDITKADIVFYLRGQYPDLDSLLDNRKNQAVDLSHAVEVLPRDKSELTPDRDRYDRDRRDRYDRDDDRYDDDRHDRYDDDRYDDDRHDDDDDDRYDDDRYDDDRHDDDDDRYDDDRHDRDHHDRYDDDRYDDDRHDDDERHDDDRYDNDRHDDDRDDDDDAFIYDPSNADPNFWSDPERMAEAGQKIADILSHKDPSHAKNFHANAELLEDRLEALDKKYERVLHSNKCEITSFAVTHDSFGYLAHEYGLKQVLVTELDPSKTPSERDLAQAKTLLQQERINTVFSPISADSQTNRALVSATGAQYAVLVEPTNQQRDSDDYLSIMEKNFISLATSMRCTK